jgi:hypothetical protein
LSAARPKTRRGTRAKQIGGASRLKDSRRNKRPVNPEAEIVDPLAGGALVADAFSAASSLSDSADAEFA